MRIRARHYATGESIDVCCADGRIASVSPASTNRPDFEAGWVAPALFDVQINGAHGQDFTSDRLTVESVREVVDTCRLHGIGGFCPTLVTSAFQTLAHGVATIRKAREMDRRVEAALPAIHLEGPYISDVDGPRGAHPRQHTRPPDWDEFGRLQDAAAGLIKLVTLAPELPGAFQFIERLVDTDIVVSIGHTAASPQQVRDAVAAGARLSTHLGNGCHPMLPRHENYLWEQLANDHLWASLICDGHHLPTALVKCFMRAKTPARIILTCDASPLSGLSAGRYSLWDQEFEVCQDGRVAVPGTDYLAGSGVFTDCCIANVMSTGVGLSDAIDMASMRPRDLLGLPSRRIQAGDPSDLILFEHDASSPFRITRTIS